MTEWLDVPTELHDLNGELHLPPTNMLVAWRKDNATFVAALTTQCVEVDKAWLFRQEAPNVYRFDPEGLVYLEKDNRTLWVQPEFLSNFLTDKP